MFNSKDDSLGIAVIQRAKASRAAYEAERNRRDPFWFMKASSTVDRPLPDQWAGWFQALKEAGVDSIRSGSPKVIRTTNQSPALQALRKL